MAYSTKRKRGRPKASAQQWDHGNERVQSRAELFRMFHGNASATGHEMSCIGRLMLVGAFDGMEQAPETYLSAVLEYSNAYWGNYGGGAKVAGYERQDRSHDTRWDDPRGERFDAMDERLRNAGHQARCAVHQVSVDRFFFPDEDVGWSARIINTKFAERKLPVSGELACDSDWAMLELLRQGATFLTVNNLRKAA